MTDSTHLQSFAGIGSGTRPKLTAAGISIASCNSRVDSRRDLGPIPHGAGPPFHETFAADRVSAPRHHVSAIRDPDHEEKGMRG